MSDATEQIEAVLKHHVRAIADRDVDEILADYAEDCLLLTPAGPFRGHAELRAFLEAFLADKPTGYMDDFKLLRRDVVDELACIEWSSSGLAPFGTDTFVFRGGKIALQTFAVHAG